MSWSRSVPPTSGPFWFSGWFRADAVDPADALRARDPSQPRKHKRPANAGLLRERLKGLEPSTFCMASRRSSQLSYSRVARRIAVAPFDDVGVEAPRRMRAIAEPLHVSRNLPPVDAPKYGP